MIDTKNSNTSFLLCIVIALEPSRNSAITQRTEIEQPIQ